MPCNYEQATDEILSTFTVAWKAGSAAIVGYIPTIYYPGQDLGVVPDCSKFWARISVQTVSTTQRSLSDLVGNEHKRRYTSNGLVFVQIFSPTGKIDSPQKTRKLAELALSAFRNCPSNVIFRNQSIDELPPENSCIRLNVVASFEYDEIV
jgi:hypothetical protein